MTACDKAKHLFQEAGLAFPTIPNEFASRLTEKGNWLFSTRHIDVSPYDLRSFVEEVETNGVEDYAILAHSGHGVNSYAIQYYLVRGFLRMFLLLGWGGVYMDRQESTAQVRDCFSLADEIVAAAPFTKRLQPGRTLTIVATDFYGSYWLQPGERHMTEERPDKSPTDVLREALSWLKSTVK